MNTPAERKNPFIGPRPFTENENLYGRERETGQLFNLLLAERIVLLYSPSGAGKTSLLRAGLLPRLKGRRFTVLPVLRVNLALSQSAAKHKGVNRYLLSVLTDLEEARPKAERLTEAELIGMRLEKYLKRFTPDRSVLIFDQFEEILTQDPTDVAAKTEFFDQVGEALQEPSRFAVFAMREDYLAGLEPYLRPIPNRLKATFRLDLLSKEAAQDVIDRTAHEGGVDFDHDAAYKLVEDLSQVQVQQPDGKVKPVSGAYVEPVQLQVVCYNLWEKLAPGQTEIKSLEKIGNVDQSLAEYYAVKTKDASEKTGIPERRIRQWFERSLITKSDIRGQVLLENDKGGDLELVAIEELENAHLVRRDTRRGTTWFELTHDRLIGPVRQANALWFKEHLSLLQQQAELWHKEGQRDDLLLRDQALDEAIVWAKAHPAELNPDEQFYLQRCEEARAERRAQREKDRRQRRTLQIVAAVALAAAIIAVVLASIAYNANLESKKNLKIARDAEQKAESSAENARNAEAVARAAAESEELSRIDAENQRDAATRQRALARAGELAVEAETVYEAFPQRGLLLAIEAIKAAQEVDLRSPQAEQALRNALSYASGAGAGSVYEEISEINISPDGRWLAVDTSSNTYFFDLSSGQPKLMPWKVPSEEIRADNLRFSPGGTWVFDQVSERLYDLRLADPFSEPVLSANEALAGESVEAVTFTGDGNDTPGWLAVLSANNLLLWDLNAQDISASLQIIPSGGGGYINDFRRLALSPSSDPAVGPRWLAVLQGDQDCYFGFSLIDLAAVADGDPDPQRRPQGEACLSFQGFSPDGKRLIMGDTSYGGPTLSADLESSGFPTKTLEVPGFPFAASDFETNSLLGADQLSGMQTQTLMNIDPELGSLAVWDVTQEEPKLKTHLVPPEDISPKSKEDAWGYTTQLSPDGRWALITDPLAAVLYDLESGPTARYYRLDEFSDIQVPTRFSPDSRWLLTGCFGGDACLYDLNRSHPGENPAILRGHESWIGRFAFSQNGSKLVTASADSTLRVWDLSQNNLSASPIEIGQVSETYSFPLLSISPDSRWLFYDERLWDLQPLAGGLEPVSYVIPMVNALVSVFSPDSRWLAISAHQSGASICSSTSEDDESHLYMWDLQALQTGEQIQPMSLAQNVDCNDFLAFSPDSRWLATTSSKISMGLLNDINQLRVWKLSEPDSSWQLSLDVSESATTLRFTTASSELISIDEQHAILFVKELDRLAEDSRQIQYPGSSKAFSADGRWFVSFDAGRYWIMDLNATQPQPVGLETTASENATVEFSPDSAWLAIGETNTISVFELSTSEGLGAAYRPNGVENSGGMAFSGDSQWLLADGWTSESTSLFGLIAPQVNISKPLVSLSGIGQGFIPTGMVGSGVTATSGIGFATQTFQAAQLWQVDELGQVVNPTALGGHPQNINSFLFSPDELWAVTLSGPNQLRLWDLSLPANGQAAEAALLPKSGSPIKALGFTPDSSWLVSVDEAGLVRLWPLITARLVNAACQVAGRNLTVTEWQRDFPNLPYRKTCPDLPLHRTAVDAVSSGMRQLMEQGNPRAALDTYHALLAQEPEVQTDSDFWYPVCDAAAKQDAYDLVRAQCDAAGIDEVQTRFYHLLDKAALLVEQEELMAAVTTLQEAQSIAPEEQVSYEQVCAKATLLGQYSQVQSVCEQAGFNESRAQIMTQVDQAQRLYQKGDYESAAGLLLDIKAIDLEYFQQLGEIIYSLCISTQLPDAETSIDILCNEPIMIEGLPLATMLAMAQAEQAWGEPDYGFSLVEKARLQGAPDDWVINMNYSICTQSARDDRISEFTESCLLAELDPSSLQGQLLEERLIQYGNSSNFEQGAILLEQLRYEDNISYETISNFCRQADRQGQFELVRTVCTNLGIDPARFRLSDRIDEMNAFLQQGNIDAARLKFESILKQYNEMELPPSLWEDLCNYGVNAGQYFKVKDACAHLSRALACPYVFTRDATLPSWTLDTTILFKLSSSELETLQRRPLRRFDGTLQVRELEQEISFIDQLYVEVMDSSGLITRLYLGQAELDRADGTYLQLRQGEHIELSFPGYEEIREPVKAWVVAEGYYLPFKN